MISSMKRIALLAVVISALSAAYVRWGMPSLPAAHALPAAGVATNPVAVNVPDFSAIVEHWGPAVVNVSTTGTVRATMQLDPDDPMFEFFRRFGLPAPNAAEQRVHGLGSGFVVGSNGLILTNAHVIDGSNEIVVRLNDKREFNAKILGVDKPTDVAVLKIEATGLPSVKIGNPDRTRVGEWVLAIGSPFGFDNTATAGIISAKSRSLPDGSYVPFLQTDVAVNPGNSGGPLFNTQGEVIGITSQIYSRSGGYQGLSFAIPIDVATQVEEQIVAHGKVTRGRLGVSIQDVNQALAESFGLSSPQGALVSGVEPNGPAARAGLQTGDVILKLDGQAIGNSSELPPRIGKVKPGTVAHLDIWRKGKLHTIEVTIGSANEPGPIASVTATPQRLGLSVRSLTAAEKVQTGENGGLVVEQVAGPAADAGIEPGDLILSANGVHVGNAEQLRALVANAGKHVALLVRRGDNRLFIPVDLS
ncbi:MAG TPA: DegQ family serine endoprotease [Rhodocyclaceae bacterium]|nr:DegQ family serine endoprotease [Rhodocyclaceae bacterium]